MTQKGKRLVKSFTSYNMLSTMLRTENIMDMRSPISSKKTFIFKNWALLQSFRSSSFFKQLPKMPTEVSFNEGSNGFHGR